MRAGRRVTRDAEPITAAIVRAFLAVTVVEPALTPLRELCARWRTQIPGVSWSRTDSWHITLRFFEDLEPGAVVSLTDAVADAVGEVAPCPVQLRGAGAFPSLHRARVLWVGAGEGTERLAELFDRADAACDSVGLGREQRAFRAHTTVGRPRRWSSVQQRAWQAVIADPVELPMFTATRLDLYESREGYHLLGSAALSSLA